MTNYELIQMLVEYPAGAEIIFKIGSLSGYDCDFNFHDHKYYPTLKPELQIIIEE